MFAGAAALPTWLALKGGGFDVVVRGETALFLWWVIAAGFGAGLIPRGTPRREMLPASIALGLLVAWTALSFAWTESDERTYAELARLLGVVAIVVLAGASLNRHTFRAAAAGVSVAVLGIAGIAVLSRLMPASFPVDEVQVAFDTDRLSYPFDYWNAVAAWGAMAIAIGLTWSAHARTTAFRAAALAMVPVAGLAVYLTYSRGGIVGVALAIAAAIALGRNRWTTVVHAVAAGAGSGVAILAVRSNPAIADATGGEGGLGVAAALLLAGLGSAAVAWITTTIDVDRLRMPSRQARRAVPVAVAVAVALVALAVAGSGAIGDVKRGFLDDELPEGSSGTERLATAGGDRNELWGSALDAFSSEPVSGIGSGAFEFWWTRDGRLSQPVVDAHSLYFETMAELGLIGLVLLLAVLAALLYAAISARSELRRRGDRGASAAMIAAFVVFCFHAGFDWMWEYPALVAVAFGGITIAAAGGTGRRPSGSTLPVGPRVGMVAAATLLGAAQLPGVVATDRLRDSEVELAAGDPEAARELASDAVSAQPWSASARSQRALAAEALGDLEDARDDVADARRREPTNWLWAAQEERIADRLGDMEGARRAAKAVDELNRLGG